MNEKYGNRYGWSDKLIEKLKREYGPYGSVPKLSHETGISKDSIYKVINLTMSLRILS